MIVNDTTAGPPAPKMTATAPQATQTGKSDIDALLTELNVNKEVFIKPLAPGETASNSYDETPVEPIDTEAANRAGQRAAALSNAVLSFGAAMIAKSTDTHEYSATDGEQDDLAEAWAGVATQYNFEVNPWISIIFLTLTIYGPKFMQAFQDRRINELQNAVKTLQNQYEEMNAKLTEQAKTAKTA